MQPFDNRNSSLDTIPQDKSAATREQLRQIPKQPKSPFPPQGSKKLGLLLCPDTDYIQMEMT